MPNYDAPALKNALTVISVLSDADAPLGVSDICRVTGLNKNMAFRILSVLLEEGWIWAEDGEAQKYSLTLRPFEVLSRPLGRMDIVTAAGDELKKVSERTSESMYLAILREGSALYLQHRESSREVKISGMTGGRYPLQCSAPGKVLLAHAGQDYIDAFILAGYKTYTAKTLSGEGLRAELEKIRSRGWALDDEEYGGGILCLAAPVFDHTGHAVGTVGTAVSTIYYSAESFVSSMLPHIAQTADIISGRLGRKAQ